MARIERAWEKEETTFGERASSQSLGSENGPSLVDLRLGSDIPRCGAQNTNQVKNYTHNQDPIVSQPIHLEA